MNLVKEAGEHWNPNQTPVLMVDQLLSAIAKEIQWLWSDSFSNNKYVIMTGGWGWGLHVEMAWRVVEWCWVARCNHNCWNSVAEFFVKVSCKDKKCPPGYSSRVPSFLMCSLSLIMLSAPNSDKHRMETEQMQFKYWALVLDIQLCVLWLLC